MSAGRRRTEFFRLVPCSAWDGPLRGLTSDAQLLILRAWTGPESQPIPGVAITGRAALAEALAWKVNRLDRAVAETSSCGALFADFNHRLVWIPRASQDGSPDNPNHVRGWTRYWSLIPSCDLKWQIRQALHELVASRGESFVLAFVEACPGPEPAGRRSAKVAPNPSQPSAQGSANVAYNHPETGSGSGSGDQDQRSGSGEGGGSGTGEGGPPGPGDRTTGVPLYPLSAELFATDPRQWRDLVEIHDLRRKPEAAQHQAMEQILAGRVAS